MNDSGAHVLEEIPVGIAKDALVRAGGNPYVLISVIDPSSGAVELVSQGLSPEQIVAGLYEAAYQLEKSLVEQAIGEGELFPTDDESPHGLAEALERARSL